MRRPLLRPGVPKLINTPITKEEAIAISEQYKLPKKVQIEINPQVKKAS